MGKGKYKNDFKLAIGDEQAIYSKVYSVLVRKNDIYLRGNKEHKISIHGSGVCHSAMTSEEASAWKIPIEERTANRWKANSKEQAEFLFGFVFPFWGLNSTTEENLSSTQVKYIPYPPLNHDVIIMFAKSNVPLLVPGTEKTIALPWELQLPNGNYFTTFCFYEKNFAPSANQIKHLLQAQHPNIRYNPTLSPEKNLRPSSGFVSFEKDGIHYQMDFFIPEETGTVLQRQFKGSNRNS